MKLITTHIPERYIEGIELLVKNGMYTNRSEVIRFALRDFLVKEGVWDHISLKASEKVSAIFVLWLRASSKAFSQAAVPSLDENL